MGACVGNEELQRFTHIPTREPLTGPVSCPFHECGFQCSTVEDMLQHQGRAEHPGWTRKYPAGQARSWHCEGCGKDFTTWDVLAKYFNIHKSPFQCQECQFSAATAGQLRKHMLAIHKMELSQQKHWVRRQGVLLKSTNVT